MTPASAAVANANDEQWRDHAGFCAGLDRRFEHVIAVENGDSGPRPRRRWFLHVNPIVGAGFGRGKREGWLGHDRH